ncbi:hypothetical protein [Streptomyces sp. NPDC052721]|uniref:hypothetical protein n=1 Tax=Streptomyces sp. NPDC052721 TaxID=3154955 RepID=UPI00342BD0CE
MALNQWADARKEAAALKRERQLRALDRNQARLDRRESFELTHLIEVHEALTELFTVALALHDAVETGVQAAPEWNGRLTATNRKVHSQKGLVLDEQARHWTTSAHAYINEMSRGGSIERPLATLETAQEAIAARIRDIYGPDLSRTPLISAEAQS